MPEKISEWGALAWTIIAAAIAAIIGLVRMLLTLNTMIEGLRADIRVLKHGMNGLKQRQEAVESNLKEARDHDRRR